MKRTPVVEEDMIGKLALVWFRLDMDATGAFV